MSKAVEQVPLPVALKLRRYGAGPFGAIPGRGVPPLAEYTIRGAAITMS
jgi:hypothetical protein